MCESLFLTGEGKDFASGADIGGLENYLLSKVNGIVDKAIRDIEMLEIPVVSVIRGYAMGGGLEIATACDLRIASEGARFGIPAAKRGSGLPVRIPFVWFVWLGPPGPRRSFYWARGLRPQQRCNGA